MKRKYLLLLVPISFLCLLLAKSSPMLAEYVFARVVFRIFAIPIGFLTSLFPFSLIEISVYVLVVLILIILIKVAVRIWRKEFSLSKSLKRWGLNLASAFSILLFLFTVLCGTNYYRYDFETYCDYKVGKYSVDELYDLCKYLAEMANATKAEMEQIDENGVVELKEFSILVKEAKKSYQTLAEEFFVFSYSTGCAKPVLASRAMSYTGIVGIYSPFTVEANVNVDVADYNRPADMCHELAHLHGFMKENEANFIAYLACLASDQPYFQYSGYMLALIHATNALYDENTAYYVEVSEMLSDAVKKDLQYESKYWDELREKESYQVIEAVSDKVNDTYLKVNGQADGVKSYGKMVDLLLAKYKLEVKET